MKCIFLLALPLLLFSCGRDSYAVRIAGEAQGTTYQVTYFTEGNDNYQAEVDSILQTIDLSLSTYVPTSIISRINRNDSTVKLDAYFIKVFKASMEVSETTGGLFDITVAPLVNAYGFGFTEKAAVDSIMIDSLLAMVGYKKVKLEGDQFVKENPGIMIDFNAIAQGYTVDVLADFLDSMDIRSYLIELGGEVKAKGKKMNNEYWEIGIDVPSEILGKERKLHAIVKLNNRSLATSGNYRRFYVENGKKYAHIIDPRTGYPANSNLLSASVIARDCMTADAYATAFMVMGVEHSKQFLTAHPDLGLEVYFIYDEDGRLKTYTSPSLQQSIKTIN
jgi:thiamine biosynthesis lipoprotein